MVGLSIHSKPRAYTLAPQTHIVTPEKLFKRVIRQKSHTGLDCVSRDERSGTLVETPDTLLFEDGGEDGEDTVVL